MVQQTILGRQSDFIEEQWVWDPNNKSPEVILSRNSHAAYFHIDPVTESTGTAGKILIKVKYLSTLLNTKYMYMS